MYQTINLLTRAGFLGLVCAFVFASAQAATFVVNSTNDGVDANVGDNVCETATAGECTLRAAIEQANVTAGTDTINFNIAPFNGLVKTIAPASALPDITQAVTIDGYTQPGSSVNTLVTTDNAVILIELDGTNAGAGVNGLSLVVSGSGSTVRGLAINRFSRDGISLNGSDNNIISGNFIGTDPTGLLDLGNGSIGIEGEFFSGNDNNTIGGTTPAARNIISGNSGSGVEFGAVAGNHTVRGNFIGLGANGTTSLGNNGAGVIFGLFTSANVIGGDDAADGTTDGVVNARNYIAGNGAGGVFMGGAATIQGNFIGTDVTGTLARPNGAGIDTNLAHNTVVGGSTAGAGNLISGNTSYGIAVQNTGGMIIKGNRIGTQSDGVSALGNGADGVWFNASSSNTQIGGTAAGEGNVIAFNGGDGVQIDAGSGNSILSNLIHTNGTTNLHLGIDLGLNGVQSNDTDDADTGANNLQNFPVLSTVSTAGGMTTIQGTLNSDPSTDLRIEFFVNSSCDSSFNGEGRTFVGAVNTLTDAGGDSPVFSLTVGATPTSNVFTATATRLDATLNPIETSEFSACAQEPDAPLTFVVNSNADTDDTICDAANCTLREAINRANVNISLDAITFNIAPGGAQTIAVGAGGLPVIVNPVSIDGTTQPGFSGSPPIELNGAGAGTDTDGLRITAGSTIIKGFVINRFNGDGIEIEINGGNIIVGNYIGTDIAGASDSGNAGRGIFISGTTANRIGGTTADERNVVSGNNGRGIEFSNGSTANLVQGNYIGTNATGTAGLGNDNSGILIGSGAHTIGGTAAGARNVISANLFEHGITMSGTSDGNIIQGNYVGTDAAGTADLGNGGGGVVIFAGAHTIGGTTVGAGNVVSGNGFEGIFLGADGSTVQGNFVGTNAAGTAAIGNSDDGIEIRNGSSNLIGGTNVGEGNTVAFNAQDGVFVSSGTGNRILGNSIFSNGDLGIDLGTNGVTANDDDDPDTGANNLQNFPVITTAQPGSTRVIGTFNSTASTTFRLEFFNTPTTDASGNGEGQTFIGSINVTTDGSGNVAFDQTFAPTAAVGSFISATATNLTTNDTSEFSNTKQVLNPTAATVSIGGRVLDATGRGIFGARIVMTGTNGNLREARTNPFGFYRFEEVGVGETYVFTISHKRYEFESQVVFIIEERDDINFTASPTKSSGVDF